MDSILGLRFPIWFRTEEAEVSWRKRVGFHHWRILWKMTSIRAVVVIHCSVHTLAYRSTKISRICRRIATTSRPKTNRSVPNRWIVWNCRRDFSLLLRSDPLWTLWTIILLLLLFLWILLCHPQFRKAHDMQIFECNGCIVDFAGYVFLLYFKFGWHFVFVFHFRYNFW